jgi:hypothetical protein
MKLSATTGGEPPVAAGYPGKLIYDFRRTAATRMDSTPGISISVAMSLLGHKTELVFRRYIQKNDDRLLKPLRSWRNGQRSRREYERSQKRKLCEWNTGKFSNKFDSWRGG